MSEDHESEAYDQLGSRIQEMRRYLDLAGQDVDVYDDDAMYDATDQEMGSVGDYGLEWTKSITNHLDETVTYRHVLSTGGPHDEFQVTFDPEKGSVDSVTFVYLPWFDRVEMEITPMFCFDNHAPGVVHDTVVSFYEQFYGDIAEAEHSNPARDSHSRVT